MISFENFGDLLSLDIGAFEPKPTSIEGEQREAAVVLWTSPNGKLETGIWECTPGRFTADRSKNSEICHLLSGSVTLHNSDGTEQKIVAGEMFVLPIGWRGEWTLHEQTRKIYTMIDEGV
ncbi:DUF861 domain-containing protein [Rhizobium daejeonense]|uniref:DUF861 domain-containing protein n=1 Tax=Rhizobium daejeonense TaxID=240521 RepID=A0A6M1SBX7_9HYPH|nr:cupin domain-containing protein [Rhizobium daejeonense]NGO65778.1 DUF861 domain-containing protein [Rhizobium daejeonense]